MPARKPKSSPLSPPAHTTPADTTAAVDAFLSELDHASKDLIQSLRAAILATDPRIAEGIKWNSPSFRTTEYFATTNLREKHGTGLILHLGAKVRSVPAGGIEIPDPTDLLDWLAKDRARITFTDTADFRAKKPAFQRLVRHWIEHV